MSGGVRHFHEELSHLKQRLMALSGEAEDAIGNAVEALLRRDKVLALEVIRGDRTINTLESAIESLRAVALIAAIGLGGVSAAFLLLLRRVGRRGTMAYAPYLSLGAMVALLYGPTIIAWYLGRFV